MTTTAQAIPALEVSAPDDNMDVLSDTAFDFVDGDIDLDLDTTTSVHDDDMSLNDAATDGGIDMSEHIDQDDFMADQGDLIEEDDVYNDNIASVSQKSDRHAEVFEADMLAPPDEDLIDYSDDEAQQPVKMHSPSSHEEEDIQSPFGLETESAQAGAHLEDAQTQAVEQPLESTTAANEEPQTLDGDVEKGPETITAGEIQDAELQREGADDIHDEEGGIALPADEHSQHDDNTIDYQEGQHEHINQDLESDDHSDQQIELRPVTVNYAGNELWLFKQHDLDDSGDFLLDELSAAKSSISELFQACRLSLGDDVSGEHEIGFRFDHLHNLELYEDNTACVAVSLERMVDLYHTLQAQDGNEDPECFYVTLQFRPRFATLLADIAQYAEQGSGYSALDAAVSAGETHFSNVFSSATTEHDQVEWDEEENEEADASSPASVPSESQGDVDADDADKLEEQRLGDIEEHGENCSQEKTLKQDDAALQEESGEAQDFHHVESEVTQEAVKLDFLGEIAAQDTAEQNEPEHELQSDAAAGQDTYEPQDEKTPDQIAHEKQEADDFVDYSDDEDEQEGKSAAHEASPSSYTVQGDDTTDVQKRGLAPELDGHDGAGTAETDFERHDDDSTLLSQTQYGDDANHYAFQNYTENYEQGDSFPEYHAEGTVEDPFEANGSYASDTNQDFADYNFQEIDGEINLGFDEQPLDDANHGDFGDETYEAVEDITHADALLDLDHAPEWAVDADPASDLPGEDAILLHDDTTAHEDEEGGVVEQPGATKSSAANLTLISSKDRNSSSPQGQKRSIDEVGDGIEDAPESTGMAPNHCADGFNADLCLPDSKRARV